MYTEKSPNEVGGRKQTLTAPKVALGINLLLHFLQDHAEKCGDIIAIKTNIRPFAAYRAKVCYPRTTDRRVYIKSVHIHRLLSKPDEGTDMENRMMHPRQLKTWRVG